MKWLVHWLKKPENRNFDFQEEILFPEETIENVSQLRKLSAIQVTGNVHLDYTKDLLYVQMEIVGTMTVPCARTLLDVEYPFSIHSSEVFAFHKAEEDEDVRIVKGDTLDLMPIIFEAIVLEIPMRVIKEDADFKSEGKNWRIVDSNEMNEEKPLVDPRFAKLKDLFKDN